MFEISSRKDYTKSIKLHSWQTSGLYSILFATMPLARHFFRKHEPRCGFYSCVQAKSHSANTHQPCSVRADDPTRQATLKSLTVFPHTSYMNNTSEQRLGKRAPPPPPPLTSDRGVHNNFLSENLEQAMGGGGMAAVELYQFSVITLAASVDICRHFQQREYTI